MAATDARPIPRKNTAYRITFSIIDADGDPVSAAADLDSEVSLDGAAFADCTNEATEIGSTGVYYLDMTAAELNADTVAVRVQTSTVGAKTRVVVLYPQEADDIRVSVSHWNGTAVPAEHTVGCPIVTVKDGTGTGEIDTASGKVAIATGGIVAASFAAGAIDAAAIADNAIDAGALAADCITAAKIADNAIDAGAIATGAITAAKFAASAIDATAIAANAITSAKIASGAITSSTFAAGAINAAALADGAIDRATFAADTGLQSIRSSTAQAGAASTITLDASASATDDFYNDAWVYLTGGTGVGQVRQISDYVGSTKVASVTPAWTTNPDATSTFAILPFGRVELTASATSVVHSGTASAGASTTITLAAAASSTNQLYKHQTIVIRSGTGAGQTRTITDYNGTTKVATIDRAWVTTPDATSVYAVLATDNFPSCAWDNVVIETGVSGKQAVNIIAAAAAGKISGAESSTITIKGIDSATTRAIATVDANGNRSALTLTLP